MGKSFSRHVLLFFFAVLAVGLLGGSLLFVRGDTIPAVPTAVQHPRFFAKKAELQAAWAQLKAATTAPASNWYDYITRHATSDVSIGNVNGAWLTHHTITMYQITGDVSWANLAWQGVQQNFINWAGNNPDFGGANNARVIVDIWIDTYDWIWPALNQGQKDSFRLTIDRLIDYMFTQAGTCCDFNTYGSWPIRSTDTDELLHDFFAILKWYIASGDESTYIYDRYLTNTSMNIGGFVPTVSSFPNPPGGKCANGCFGNQGGWAPLLSPNMRTAVAAIFQYYYTGGGGWYPSGYMLEGVHSRVAYDWAALRYALGTDYFPEVGNTLLDFAMRMVQMSTNDALWMYRWSDDEVGFGGQTALYITLSVIATTTSWYQTDVRQQYCYWLMSKLLANNPDMIPYDEFYFTYAHTPSIAGQSIATAVANGDLPQGEFSWDMMGLGSYHTGWTAQDSTFFFEFQPYSFFDHFTIHVGNFALYRKGQWGPYSPISYGAPTSDGEVTNTMNFYGFPLASQLLQIREYKGMLGTAFGPNWAFYIGANCGTINLYDGRYTQTTSTFIQEYSRNSLYYHGTNADVILIFDRSNIVDPSTLPYWTNDQYSYWSINTDVTDKVTRGYYPRRNWKWHAVTQPSLGTNTLSYAPIIPTGDENSGFSWTASTDQTVTMETHFTCTYTTALKTDTIAQANAFDWYAPDNTGWIIYERNAFDSQWDATLHVIAMADVGYQVTTVSYTSTPAAAKMAVVELPSGDNNVVVIYNVLPGATLPSPDCCNGAGAGTCGLGNYPCVDDPSVKDIVPTQHFFPTNVTYFGFGEVTLSSSTVEFFLNDLAASLTYDLFIDQTLQATVGAGNTTEGFARVAVSGVSTTGTHTVCVEVSGTGSCGSNTFPASTINLNCPANPTTSSPASHLSYTSFTTTILSYLTTMLMW